MLPPTVDTYVYTPKVFQKICIIFCASKFSQFVRKMWLLKINFRFVDSYLHLLCSFIKIIKIFYQFWKYTLFNSISLPVIVDSLITFQFYDNTGTPREKFVAILLILYAS